MRSYRFSLGSPAQTDSPGWGLAAPCCASGSPGGLGSLFTTGTHYPPPRPRSGLWYKKEGIGILNHGTPLTLTLPRCAEVSLGSLVWGQSRNGGLKKKKWGAGSQTDLHSNPGSVRDRLGGREQGSYLLSLDFSATKWVCCEDEVLSFENLVHVPGI